MRKNHVHFSYTWSQECTWYKSLDVALHCSASPSIKIIILMTLQSLKVKHYLFWFKLIICNWSYSFVLFNVSWVVKFSLAEFQLSQISQKIDQTQQPPIYLHLIYKILSFEISSLMNLLFLPAVAWKIQVKIRFYFQSISN